MIIDCFTFFDELDLLEIRLHELKDVVDVFVLTEAPYTFTGLEKPLYFNDNKERFKDFNIMHTVYKPKGTYKPHVFEKHQRQFNLDRAFDIFKSGDVIMTNDADEIPRASVLKAAIKDDWKFAGVQLKIFYYYMNCKGTIRKEGSQRRLIRPDGWFEFNIKRSGRNDKIYYDGGWHFSFLGDIQKKIGSWGHAPQYNKPPYNTTEHIEKCKEQGLDLFMRKGRRRITFEYLNDLNYLPQYVLNNMDKYRKYIKWQS